jgi:hypothetical protein
MIEDTIKISVLEIIESISRQNEDRKKTAEIGKVILEKTTKHIDDYHHALLTLELGPLSNIISQHTINLKNKILADRDLLIQSAAHSAGALEGTRLVHKKILQIEQDAIDSIKTIEENKKIESEMERKIEEEDLEENKVRGFGERPESLKQIRNAKKRLKMKKKKDSESSK